MTEVRRQPPRATDAPEPGFFLMKLVKHGPLVPVAIFHRNGEWSAEIVGQRLPSHPDPVRAEKVLTIWHYARETITRDEYVRRLEQAKDPSHPASNPRKPVDLANADPLF
jgi:hypothetical protein